MFVQNQGKLLFQRKSFVSYRAKTSIIKNGLIFYLFLRVNLGKREIMSSEITVYILSSEKSESPSFPALWF